MNKIIEISVIIPIYNEESTCQEIINKVKKIDLVKEIIVVDDCSTDSTFEIINNIDDINIIKHDKNLPIISLFEMRNLPFSSQISPQISLFRKMKCRQV